MPTAYCLLPITPYCLLMTRVVAFLTLLLSLSALVGCAGYQIGNQTLYNTNIRTIYVPMVKSTLLRPHLSERITEAVVKEIELRTPYKIARDNYADAILNIEIVDYKQGINFKDKWGGPRQNVLDLKAKVELVDRKTLSVNNSVQVSIDKEDFIVMGSGSMIPVAGQSTATEQQAAIDRLAQSIVNVLEIPW